MKEARQRRIAELLRTRRITSQAALADALEQEGARVTQATLSRDLDELGAIRVKEGHGRAVYRIPEEPVDAQAHLRQMLARFASEITPATNLVVVRTPPGCAQAVARAVDHAGVDGALATIAGDDTILVVPDENTRARALAARLETLTAPSIDEGASRP